MQEVFACLPGHFVVCVANWDIYDIACSDLSVIIGYYKSLRGRVFIHVYDPQYGG